MALIMEESFDPSLLCLSYYISLNGAGLNVFRYEWWQLFDLSFRGRLLWLIP